MLSWHVGRANVVEVTTYSTHLFGDVSECESIHGRHLKLTRDAPLVFTFILNFTFVESKEFSSPYILPFIFSSAFIPESEKLDAQHRSQDR